uniref:alpha-N-acetylgalactosaminide alpha-2,6-sialyltransferase n=1 Tax=Dicentrarchus labrax TaxID=13489 RepID=A0A8P4GGT8_DICLA
MALLTSRITAWLFVVSVTVVLLIISWGYLSESISRTAVSGKFRYRGEGSLFEYWDIIRNSTSPPPVFTTSHKPKTADATKTVTVTKLKPDRITATTSAPVVETPMPILSRNSFKRLPQWDFEEVYNQDAPPRQTTCAQSLRKSEDPSFKKAFLPNIRLYLHKDNFNMSEWNRLSHFNNPFGFMGFKYDEVIPAVKLIPKPNEPLLLPKPGSGGCVRCAVVGTGGILNGSKKGKEIDSHDYVFRMNGAIIKGYEEDVGNKTSVYVHTAHSITMSQYLLKKYGYTSIPNDEGIKHVLIPEGMRDFFWLEGLLKGERVTAGPFLFSVYVFLTLFFAPSFLKSRNLNATFWAIVRPTNGAFTVFLALHTCDVVDLYGFMTEDYNKYSNYYVEKTKTHVVFYANHDYTLEKNLWSKLHKSKIVKLYQRTDAEAQTEKPKQH